MSDYGLSYSKKAAMLGTLICDAWEAVTRLLTSVCAFAFRIP